MDTKGWDVKAATDDTFMIAPFFFEYVTKNRTDIFLDSTKTVKVFYTSTGAQNKINTLANCNHDVLRIVKTTTIKLRYCICLPMLLK